MECISGGIMKRLGNVLTILFVLTLVLSGCGGGSSTQASTPIPDTYSLQGQIQKGPFAIGSQISVNELDSNLNPVGNVYNIQTVDDLGNFSVGTKIHSRYVEIIGDGFYMDELTGQLSSSRTQLRAIADLKTGTKVSVNILTAIQALRLKKLVSQGTTFAEASTRSQNEVLSALGVDPTKVTGLSNLITMKINGTNDSDSVLLALSSILSKMASNQATSKATSQPTELSSYINTIASQIQNTGILSSTTISNARSLATTQIDLAAVRANVETYYADRGVTIVAPKFEEWVDKEALGVLPRRLVPVTGLAFTNAAEVEPNQLVTSNTIIVAGLGSGVAATISVNSGTTIIKNGAAVTGTISTVVNGDTIALQLTSPGYGLTHTATISAGISSAIWQVTSKQLSVSNIAFNYTDVAEVEPNQLITSNTIIVAGLGSGVTATIAVNSGATIIKNGAAVSDTFATVVDGDTLALQVTSLGYGLTHTATIYTADIQGGIAPGGISTWQVTSKQLSASGTVFNYTGANQIFTVPAGVTLLRVEMWGGGGGGGGKLNVTDIPGTGGGGAYAMSEIAVAPGELLTVKVGGGGGGGINGSMMIFDPMTIPFTQAIILGGLGGWPGGGNGGAMTSFGWLGASGGGGGGYSALLRNSTTLVISGGGGGGGGATYNAGTANIPNGGAAGSTGIAGSGQATPANGGGGGNAFAGGNAGVGVVTGQAGSSLLGGNGQEGSGNGRPAGGGGGGGYFGGGSGSSGNSSYDSGGGGGGSSFGTGTTIFTSGNGAVPGSSNSPNNGGAGYGGGNGSVGSNGKVVISY